MLNGSNVRMDFRKKFKIAMYTTARNSFDIQFARVMGNAIGVVSLG